MIFQVSGMVTKALLGWLEARLSYNSLHSTVLCARFAPWGTSEVEKCQRIFRSLLRGEEIRGEAKLETGLRRYMEHGFRADMHSDSQIHTWW